jgi:hypothetical protein
VIRILSPKRFKSTEKQSIAKIPSQTEYQVVSVNQYNDFTSSSGLGGAAARWSHGVWRDEGERGLRPEYWRSSVVDGGAARRSPPGGAATRWTCRARSGAGARGRVHDEQPTETATATTIPAKSRSSSSSTSTGRAKRGGSEVGARSGRRGGGYLRELHAIGSVPQGVAA